MNKLNKDDWRNDPSLESNTIYQKKFALLPVTCNDGSCVWLKSYYKKYTYWYHKNFSSKSKFDDDDYCHTDFLGRISEEEYIIAKLSETL